MPSIRAYLGHGKMQDYLEEIFSCPIKHTTFKRHSWAFISVIAGSVICNCQLGSLTHEVYGAYEFCTRSSMKRQCQNLPTRFSKIKKQWTMYCPLPNLDHFWSLSECEKLNNIICALLKLLRYIYECRVNHFNGLHISEFEAICLVESWTMGTAN